MNQHVSELERQIQQGRIPRNRIKGFLESFYARTRNQIPSLKPAEVEEAAALLQRHGFEPHAQKLLHDELYEEAKRVMSLYAAAAAKPESITTEHEEAIYLVVRRGYVNAAELSVHVRQHMDDCAYAAQDFLAAGRDFAPKVWKQWGMQRQLYTRKELAQADALGKRVRLAEECAAIADGRSNDIDTLETAIEYGVLTREEADTVVEEAHFMQNYDFKVALHVADPFLYAHPTQSLLQDLVLLYAKMQYPLLALRDEEKES